MKKTTWTLMAAVVLMSACVFVHRPMENPEVSIPSTVTTDHVKRTVYEALTQQYELAKVQEAKETPSVKVLDPAIVPEDKSFPPRLLIVFLGTSFVLISCVVWVWGGERWKEVDPQDPRKIFLQEAADALKSRMPWMSREGEVQGLGTRENELGSYHPPGRGPVDL